LDKKGNLHKFLRHMTDKGFFYALWRGFKYAFFLVKKEIDRPKDMRRFIISSGKIKISLSGVGVDLFSEETRLTSGAGLSIGINTLGIWTDSTRADWIVLDKTDVSLRLKVVFHELPLAQIWTMSFKGDGTIDWQVDMSVEELLCIDEYRIACSINPKYKTWFNKHHQDDFPSMGADWRDILMEDTATSLIGARFPVDGIKLPS